MNSYSDFEKFIQKNSQYQEILNRNSITIKHLYHLLINLINLLVHRQTSYLSQYYTQKVFLCFPETNLVFSINQNYPSEIISYNRNSAYEIDFSSLINGMPFHSNFFHHLCLDNQGNYVMGIPDWFFVMYIDDDDFYNWRKYVYNTNEYQDYKYKHKQVILEIKY